MLARIFQQKLKHVQSDLSYEITFPNGSKVTNGEQSNCNFKLHFKNNRSFRRIVFGGELVFWESYMGSDLDIEGSVPDFIRFALQIKNRGDNSKPASLADKIFDVLHEFRFGNRSIKQAIQNAKFHYNRGSEELFLSILMLTRHIT